jgi:hypothetical protein
MDDLELTTLIKRLSRPHPSGGVVIERAAILASGGADSPAIIDWIIAHSGTPETDAPTTRSRGLHGSRINDGNDPATRKPMRFVLPASTLS